MSVNNTIEQTLYLLRLALAGKDFQSGHLALPISERLYSFSKRQMISAIIAYALEKEGIKDDAFVHAKARAVRKMVILDSDKKTLFHAMDNNGIWYVPLKGSVVKELYPSYGIREMSDFDILYDSTKAVELRRIMEGLGYKCTSFGKGATDNYQKKPLSRFEMHRVLFGPSDKTRNNYYKDVFKRLTRCDDQTFQYRFSHEDEYIFIVAHGYKHYSVCGVGLRLIADVYLYLHKYGNQMDMGYVGKECEKLGIKDFETQIRNLSLDFFAGKELSKSEKSMLEYICKSGAFGTAENRVRNQKKGRGKLGGIRYIWNRIFIPMGRMKEKYPRIYKYRPLIVFLPFIRIREALTVKKKSAMREVKEAMKR